MGLGGNVCQEVGDIRELWGLLAQRALQVDVVLGLWHDEGIRFEWVRQEGLYEEVMISFR